MGSFKFIVSLLETAYLVFEFCSVALINIYSSWRPFLSNILIPKDLGNNIGKIRVIAYTWFVVRYLDHFKIQLTYGNYEMPDTALCTFLLHLNWLLQKCYNLDLIIPKTQEAQSSATGPAHKAGQRWTCNLNLGLIPKMVLSPSVACNVPVADPGDTGDKIR